MLEKIKREIMQLLTLFKLEKKNVNVVNGVNSHTNGFGVQNFYPRSDE